MKLTIDIELGNDDFHPDFNKEVGRILRDLADRLPQSEQTPKTLMDTNGNTVGEARLAPGPDKIFVVVHGPEFVAEAFSDEVDADAFAEARGARYISGPWEISCKR